jgi:hypothetical protein
LLERLGASRRVLGKIECDEQRMCARPNLARYVVAPMTDHGERRNGDTSAACLRRNTLAEEVEGAAQRSILGHIQRGRKGARDHECGAPSRSGAAVGESPPGLVQVVKAESE